MLTVDIVTPPKSVSNMNTPRFCQVWQVALIIRQYRFPSFRVHILYFIFYENIFTSKSQTHSFTRYSSCNWCMLYRACCVTMAIHLIKKYQLKMLSCVRSQKVQWLVILSSLLVKKTVTTTSGLRSGIINGSFLQKIHLGFKQLFKG